MNKTCGRCKDSFACTPEDISACGCTKIKLSEHTKTYLSKTSYDCLCNACLDDLNHLVNTINNRPIPEPKDLKDGLHYYIENGNLVFTEFYHIQKNYCCQQDCRHCAYGYGK